MSAAEVLKNIGTGLVGLIEKAVIEIKDKRGMEVQIEDPVPMRGSSPVGALQISSAVSMNAGGLSQTLQSTAGALTGFTGNTAASALGGAAANVVGAAASLAGGNRESTKYFNVQFNPNELRLTGYGGGYSAKTDFSGKGGGVSMDALKVRISMEVKLYFDKVDAQDAFMGDKINLAPSALVTGATKAVLSSKGKEDFSVQTEVEGLMAALRSRYTREISFHWGSMCYTGVLNRVSAQYTMFNVQGQPIRAEVDLSLTCADQELNENALGYWQTYYDQAFKGQNQSYVSAAQKAGNLLNFNL